MQFAQKLHSIEEMEKNRIEFYRRFEEDIMNNKEITDILYDTLMQNKQHEQLNLDKVEDQVVDRKRGWITFNYEDVTVYINISCMRRTE